MLASTRRYVARTVSRGAICPTNTIGIPRERTLTRGAAGAAGGRGGGEGGGRLGADGNEDLGRRVGERGRGMDGGAGGERRSDDGVVLAAALGEDEGLELVVQEDVLPTHAARPRVLEVGAEPAADRERPHGRHLEHHHDRGLQQRGEDALPG